MLQSALLSLILLSCSGWVSGLCTLENGTAAICHDLEDVRYIETYDLESLRAHVAKAVLHPGYFATLTSLRHLDLSGGDIERIEAETFHKLNNLRSLDLAENRLTHLELAAVDGLNHLHRLNLRKNDLRQLPPVLGRLKVLKYLDIQGNPIECNCATLRVRDLIVKRGVKIMRRALCAGPSNVKGTPLLKVDTTITCNLEEQDREMQQDQAFKDSAEQEEFGSGEKPDDGDEYLDISSVSSEAPKEVEIETPYPNSKDETSTPLVPVEPSLPDTSIALGTSDAAQEVTTSSSKTPDKEEEIFFDPEEKSSTVVATTERRKVYKDALFYPVEGSGEGDEGSGEGSGTDPIFGDWTKIGDVERTSEKEEAEEESSSSGGGLFDLLFNVFWSTTEAPRVEKEPSLEEEQFIDVSSTKEVEEEMVTRKVAPNEAASSTTETVSSSTSIPPTNGVELVDDKLQDTSKLGKVKASNEEGDGSNDKLAEVSPAKQSKKGMGSYVVLAALLAILATLIGFAAYKGDFCKKKRKRGDVEHGTELKDMQRSLLETGGSSTQPKVASNGNVESSPLVQDAADETETKVNDDRQVTVDVTKSSNLAAERAQPVKPARNNVSQIDHRTKDTVDRDADSLNDDSLSARISASDPVGVDGNPVNGLSEANQPPLSPGAQRVKITLQENPDSVPKTPILITRTMAGENLVKSS